MSFHPRDHHPDCGFQFEQYPSDCDCGITGPRASWHDRPKSVGPDALITRVFATPQGSELLDWMDQEWSVLAAPLIRQAIARERKRWSTGGSVSDAGGSRDS